MLLRPLGMRCHIVKDGQYRQLVTGEGGGRDGDGRGGGGGGLSLHGNRHHKLLLSLLLWDLKDPYYSPQVFALQQPLIYHLKNTSNLQKKANPWLFSPLLETWFYSPYRSDALFKKRTCRQKKGSFGGGVASTWRVVLKLSKEQYRRPLWHHLGTHRKLLWSVKFCETRRLLVAQRPRVAQEGLY